MSKKQFLNLKPPHSFSSVARFRIDSHVPKTCCLTSLHPWPLTWCLFASCLTPLREADLPGRAVASGVPVRRAGGGGVWRHQLAGARGGVVPRGPGDHRGPPQWVTPSSSLVGRPALESLAPARHAWLTLAFSCLRSPLPPLPPHRPSPPLLSEKQSSYALILCLYFLALKNST